MKSLGKKMLSLMLSMLMLLSSVGTLGVLAAREYEGELSIFKNIVDFENIVYSEYNTVYVPMEEVCGYLNIGVSKLEEGKFTLTRITDTLSFSVDNTVININGRDVTLPAAPAMRNGVVYIPAELFSMGFAMPMTKSADNRSADIEPNVYKIFIDEQNAAAISAATPDVDSIASSASANDSLYYNAAGFPENQKAVFYKFDLSPFNAKNVRAVSLELYAAKVSGTSPTIKITRTAPWEKGSMNFTNAPASYDGESVSRALSNTSLQLTSFDITSMASSAKKSGEVLSLRFDGVVPASRGTETANQVNLRSVTNASPSYIQVTLDEKYDFPIKAPEGAKSVAEEYNKANLLRSLGIITTEDEFPLDMKSESVSRGEFVKFAMRLRGNKPADGSTEQYFSDVPADNIYFKEINAARSVNYVTGDAGIEFRPFTAITLNEAATIIGRILDYDVYAMQKGGYAQGYLDAATKQKLLTGVRNFNGTLTFEGMINLLYNCLTAPMFEATVYYSNANVEYAFNENKTILSEYFDAKIIKGKVTANEYSALPGYACAEGKIKIDTMSLILHHKPYNEYLGYNVKAYYNSENELLYMGVEDKSVDVINLGEVTGSQKSGDTITVSYRNENGKNNTRTLSASSMKYIYNGMYEANPTAALFLADGGEARIINNDTVIITAYKTVVVYGVNLDSETIYDKYKKYDNSLLLQDSDYSFVNEDGVNIPLEAIVKDNVISVAKSKDGKMVRGIVSSRLVTSKVEAVENEGSTDMKVTAGGMEYKVKNQIDDWTKWLKAGTEGTFYIDVFGNIVGFTANAKEDIPGYILTVAEGGSGLRKKLQAAIMVKSDEDYVVYDFADKVIIDGEKYTKNGDIAKQFRRDFDDSKTITSEFKPQGIIFTLNDENRITKVDTFHVGTNENPKTTLNRRWGFEDKNPEGSTYAYPRHKGGSLGGKFHINMDEHLSVMRTNDTNPALEDYKSVTKGVQDDGKMAFEIYTIGHNFPEPVVFAFAGEINNTVPSTSRLMIVDRVVMAFDEDGMEVQRMYYYDGDKRTSVDAAYEAAAEMTGVKRGDIVRFGTDADGKLLCLDTHYDSATHAITTTGYFSAASRVYGGYTLAVEGKYVKVSTSTTESEDYSWVNSDKFASFFYKYEANSAGIEVTKATLADIRPFDQVPFETTGMVLCAGYENLRKNVYLVELESAEGFHSISFAVAEADKNDSVNPVENIPQAKVTRPALDSSNKAKLEYRDGDTDPNRKNYTFDGWDIQSTEAVEHYNKGDMIPINGNTVLVATWRYTPTLTFNFRDDNGNSFTDEFPVEGGKSLSDASTKGREKLVNEGYVIDGWALLDEGGSVKATYGLNDNFTPEAVAEGVTVGGTFKATWRAGWNGKPATGTGVPTTNASGYYEIFTPEDLAWFANYVNAGNTTANAVLMNSITLNDTGSTANNWYQYSIGTETNSYKGIFDGGNFTISNLYIEGAENAGFFGVTEGATIKNLTIADAKVVSTIADTTANKYTGVLTAVAENATIENVTLSGQMSPKSGSHYMLCAGSVAGVTKGQTSIKKCTSTVSITATDYSSTVGTIKAGYGIGGLVGFAFNGDTNLKTTIEGCTYDGKINTPYNYMVGGIVGHLNQHHTVVINKTTVSGTLTAYVKGTTTSEAILGHKSSSSSHSKLTLGTGENANTVTITTAYTSN